MATTKKIDIDIELDASGSVKSVKKLNESLDKLKKTREELVDEDGKIIDPDQFDKVNKKIKKTEEALKDMDETAKELSLGDKFAELPGLVGSAAQSLQGLKGAFDILSAHPIVLAITLLVAALTAGIERMKETREGAAQLDGVMSALSQALNPILDVFAELASILIEALLPVLSLVGTVMQGLGKIVQVVVIPIFEGLGEIIKFIVEGFTDLLVYAGLVSEENAKQSETVGKLVEEYNNLLFIKEDLETQAAKEKRDIEALKKIRDNELIGINQRIEANKEIFELEEERNNKLLSNQEKIVANLEEQLKFDKDNIELNNQLNEAKQQYYEILEEGDGIEAEAIANRQGLIREELAFQAQASQFEVDKLNAVEAGEESIFNARVKSINKQLRLLERRGATELAEYKDLTNQLVLLQLERTTALENAREEELLYEIDFQLRKANLIEQNEQKRIENEIDAQAEKIIQMAQNIDFQNEEEVRAYEKLIDEKEILEIQLSLLKQKIWEDDAKFYADLTKKQNEQAAEDLRKSQEENLKALSDGLSSISDIGLGALSSDVLALNDAFNQLSNTLFDPENGLISGLFDEDGNFILEEGFVNATEAIGVLSQVATEGVSQNLAAIRENEAVERQRIYDEDKQALESALENRKLSQEQYENELKELENKKQREELAAKRKGFQQEKKLALVNASIQSALGVAKAIPNIPLMALAAGFGAVQIAAIGSQRAPFNKGGLVRGAGTGLSDSIDASLSNGESVINARSTSMFSPILSAINQAGGGDPFPVPTTSVSDNITNNNSNNGRVYVLENDISQSQKRVTRIEDNSEF